MMKTLGLLAAAAAVVGVALAAAIPALAAAPPPNCDLRLTNAVNDTNPPLSSHLKLTLTASVQCNFDAVVTVTETLDKGLAQDPAGEPLVFTFNAPSGQRVTRTFTVGAFLPGVDGCGVHETNTASAAAQVPQGEGAVAFTTATNRLTSRCSAPLLPATGQRA
jgi:hypothetical protein